MKKNICKILILTIFAMLFIFIGNKEVYGTITTIGNGDSQAINLYNADWGITDSTDDRLKKVEEIKSDLQNTFERSVLAIKTQMTFHTTITIDNIGKPIDIYSREDKLHNEIKLKFGRNEKIKFGNEGNGFGVSQITPLNLLAFFGKDFEPKIKISEYDNISIPNDNFNNFLISTTDDDVLRTINIYDNDIYIADYENIRVGNSVDAAIVVKCVGGDGINIFLEQIYTGDDISKAPPDSDEIVDFDTEGLKLIDWLGENLNKIQEALEWLKRPGDCLLYLVSNVIKSVGDFFQLIANSIAISVEKNEVVIHGVGFTVSELLPEGEYHDILDKYTKVSSNPDQKSETGSEIPIKKITQKTDDSDGDYALGSFTADTKIPVIVVDYYTLAANKVPGTDANFLDPGGSDAITHGTMWTAVRNFVVNIIYAIMYVTGACLIITLIWNGIKIVKVSLTSPQERKKHMEGLQRFVIALVMFVRSNINKFFMCLCK